MKIRFLLIALLVVQAAPASAQLTFTPVITVAGETHHPNRGAVEVGYREQLRIEVRSPNAQNPNVALPFQCLVNTVGFTVSGADTVATRVDTLQLNYAPRSYSVTASSIFESASIKATNLNIDDMAVAVTVRLRRRSSLDPADQCWGVGQELPDEHLQFDFPLDVRHYGTYVLVNINPLGDGAGAQLLGAVSGALKALEYSSIDYPIVLGRDAFNRVMLSAPVVTFERRDWLRHLDLQIVALRTMDGEDALRIKGGAIGVWKPKRGPAVFKLGALQEREPDTNEAAWRVLIGFSAPAIAQWIVGHQR